MVSAIQKRDEGGAIAEKVLIEGDLASLSPQERIGYYQQVCESLGLNPVTKPFEYIKLNGKLTLYVRKEATEQLRRSLGVSIVKLEREAIEGVYIVTAHAQTKDGRVDAAQGIISIEGLKGEAKANAMMKAETKAKRRVTLSILGLGFGEAEEGDDFGGDRTPLDFYQSKPWQDFLSYVTKAEQSEDGLDKLIKTEAWAYKRIENGQLPRIADNAIDREIRNARERIINRVGAVLPTPEYPVEEDAELQGELIEDEI